MSEHIKLRNLTDYFTELSGRQNRGVYFYRINGYSEEIGEFIKKYYNAARKNGVILEGKIPNPDKKNLSYYEEIMGMDFQMNRNFIAQGLKKWLPRMNDRQREGVAASLYDSLDSMRKAGKTENMVRNAYVKFMCWLYYKFERIVNRLGENAAPKILYEGQISSYELMLLSILSNAGCDVVLLQYGGDQEYLKTDPQSKLSDVLQIDKMQPFPPGYSLKKVREAIQRDFNREKLYGTESSLINCTNAWIKEGGIENIKVSAVLRGTDPNLFYNCFLRINGVEDKLTYANELLRLQQELRNAKRRFVIVNGGLPTPAPDEISGIKRANYTGRDQMILDLAVNIKYPANPELQRIMKKAFADIILAEAEESGDNLNRLTRKAVYLLCWLKRYMPNLFENWKRTDVGCFICLGGCRDGNEAVFLRFLARLPVDVLILCPNLSSRCCLKDRLLYEINYTESLSMTEYPDETSHIRIGTAAYHAERELDTLIYQDSGLYRNRQYENANTVSLQTMYEEIKLLWDQEVKYRPGFGIVDGTVNIPVIFAKISGVKDGRRDSYWAFVEKLITPDTIVIKKAPYIKPAADNPMNQYTPGFLRAGRLQRAKIKEHKNYPYGILREAVQDFMLDKLQLLIDQQLIKGTGQNGTEYTVIATVLNLPEDIIRMIHSFDFTRKNPKLIYINTGETPMSPEDAILTAFLNLIGFDILFFIPTGYRGVEKYFNGSLMEEHQIGEYLYDLQVPDLQGALSGGSFRLPFEKIKKIFRGN